MRTFICVAAVLGLVLSGPAARGSGSTRVEASGESFLVSIETPRKIFVRGRGETEWHRAKREQLTREVAVLQPLIEAALKKGRETGGTKWKLRKYDADLAAHHDGTDDADFKKDAPCRFVFAVGDGVPLGGYAQVQIALESLPAAKDRTELKELVQKAVKDGYRAPARPGEGS